MFRFLPVDFEETPTQNIGVSEKIYFYSQVLKRSLNNNLELMSEKKVF